MELIIHNDGLYTLVELTKDMIKHIKLFNEVNCFELCDILRIEFSTYYDSPINKHIMNDGSGDFFGCICR